MLHVSICSFAGPEGSQQLLPERHIVPANGYCGKQNMLEGDFLSTFSASGQAFLYLCRGHGSNLLAVLANAIPFLHYLWTRTS